MSLQTSSPELSLSNPDLGALLRGILGKGSSARFRAKGFSMSPFIKDSDVVTVSPCSPAGLHSGDIAACTCGASSRLVIHRIVGKRGEMFLVKGDNLAGSDGLFHGSQMLGRITRVERNGRNMRIGLGAERRLIALFSRFHILPLLITPARILFRARKKIA